MDQIDPKQLELLTKNYMKTMPIWDYHDKFKTNIDRLAHDIRSHQTSLDSRAERINKIPSLNLTGQYRRVPSNSANGDLDIIKVYQKTIDGYLIVDQEKCDQLKKRAQSIPFRDESILKLEEKFSVDQEVYAMVKTGQPWVKCKIISVFRKPTRGSSMKPSITFRLRAPTAMNSRIIDVSKFAIARIQDHMDKLKPPKRVIAGLSNQAMSAGIIGEEPVPENLNRYLVLMDDGSARYFSISQVLPILGQSSFPWFDARYLGIDNPVNEAHLRTFFSVYPRKCLLTAHLGEKIEMMRNGALVSAKILKFDCSVMTVVYKDNQEETIYRGSPRLLKRENEISFQLRHSRNLTHFYDRLLILAYIYEEVSRRALDEDLYQFIKEFDNKILVSKSRNTARKSSSMRQKSPPRVQVDMDGHMIQESIDVIDIEQVGDMKGHKCTPECLNVPGIETEISVNDIVDEFRNVSDLKVPLLLGWKRRLSRLASAKGNKFKVVVVYEAPCGKIFQNLYPLRRYLVNTGSKFDIDYFSFDRDIKLNQSLGALKAYTYVENIAVDSKTRKPLENKNVSLMNQFSEECLPDDFEYRNKSFPHPLLRAKNFSFNHEFKSGCDCEDDCSQRTACHCHQLNEEFFGRPKHNTGAVEYKCQYVNKRLMGQVATGIFECNSFCKCSSKCSNRVVQNGIRFRLQVQKTLNKGWGIITLDDIPRGAFICTYSAELLDDADQYGDSDMYYADLDYISVAEEQKLNFSDTDEGISEDSEKEVETISKKKSKLTKSKRDEYGNENIASVILEEDSSDSTHSSDEPVIIDKYLPTDSAKNVESRYPRRGHQREIQKQPDKNSASFPKGKPKKTKFLKIHDILNSHDYTLDARMQGNVGRFFNHSCDPNSFVQNVFIETQDLRFPEVAFFALRTIKAMGEITWNYNYKMGTIAGRRIDCHCGASNCKGRIL